MPLAASAHLSLFACCNRLLPPRAYNLYCSGLPQHLSPPRAIVIAWLAPTPLSFSSARANSVKYGTMQLYTMLTDDH
eukprot:scaffold434180_cov40-Prasinocladus_malaysianus.AAC.1